MKSKRINWSEINSVNIKEIDAQHKGLVDIINELYDVDESDINIVDITIKKLIDYANNHLKYEEILFDKYNYPEKDEHKKMHNQYKEKINFFIKEYESGNKKILIEIKKFLVNWWLHHINNIDIKYSDFLNINGVY